MPVISVMWGLGLLAAISLSLFWNGTMSYGLARNGLDVASTNATVDAAVNRAVVALLDPRSARRWRTDGVPESFDFGETAIKVAIQDELGRIDLNQAEPATIVGLLQSVGLDPGSATSLADKIVDWRTTPPLKHLNGAKDQDYFASGGAFRPRNGPFQSVDELLLVMGMTPALYRRIEPALTVYSGKQLIDPQVAPREVLQALAGMTPDKIESALAARASLPLAADRSAGDLKSFLRGRAFAIRTEFEKSNRTIAYETIVRLTENPAQPYWLLSRRPK